MIRPRSTFLHGLALVVATTVSGCTTATPIPKLGREIPSHWRNQEEAPRLPPVDLYGWWRAFDDPLLNHLVDQALESNLDVAVALERLRGERALYGRRQAPHRPHLNVRTSDPIDPDASASYFVIGFDATWELGLFGRGQAVADIATGRYEEATATLREARVSLVAEVVRNFVQLRAAQQREQLLEDIVNARKRKAKLEQIRVKLKLDAPNEQARADAAVSAAISQLAEPRAAANMAAQGLALLLGRDEPDPIWLKRGSLPALGPNGPIAAPIELLRSQPQIARAEARVIEAAGKLGIARADLYPRIGLGASLLWSANIATENRPSSTNSIATLGPLIDIPLFDWGMRKAREQAQDHGLKAAVLAYRQAVLAAVSDVEISLGNLQQLRSQEDASEQASVGWASVLNAQRTRRRLGLASDLDCTDVEVSSTEAQLQLAAARLDRDIAYVALYKALGGAPPLADHVEPGTRALQGAS